MEGIEARLLATDDSDLGLEIMEIKMKGRGVVVSGTVGIFFIVAGRIEDPGILVGYCYQGRIRGL